MMDVMTTNDVALICEVDRKTVSKWIDQGILKGYKVIKHRRVLPDELESFLKERNMSEALAALELWKSKNAQSFRLRRTRGNA